uniref:Uncharacterized protein n=1 Tax=Anguilla anguilla TaxID=7936 RepID=A0A0E9VDI6_ANGAN
MTRCKAHSLEAVCNILKLNCSHRSDEMRRCLWLP